MTPVEIEAEFKSLREQFSRSREQEELRRMEWLRIGFWCWCLALLLFATAAIVFVLGVWNNNSGVTVLGPIIGLQIFPVILLGRALASGRDRPEVPNRP
jgi:hypothetical protein